MTTLKSAERSVMKQALEALKTAHTGLEWYRDHCPDAKDGSDDEADEEIGNAMDALRAALADEAATQPAASQRLSDERIEFGLNNQLEDPSEDEVSGFYAGARWAEAVLDSMTAPSEKDIKP